jgi:peroxiredoxin
MHGSNQNLDKYVGHLAEGALRFRNQLSVGTAAPDFELRSLEGDLVCLSDYRSKSNVVLIFGSFTCGSTVTPASRRESASRYIVSTISPQGLRVLSYL